MATSVTKIVKVEEVKEIPEGQYEGIWGGYQVRFMIGNDSYELTTTDGIRTINAKCIVTSFGGQVYVKAVERC